MRAKKITRCSSSAARSISAVTLTGNKIMTQACRCVRAIQGVLIAAALGRILPIAAATEGPESRRPVNSITCPGDAQHTFVIRTPGSYFLEGNLLGQPGQNGILVAADDVSLDLNGFSLRGNATGGDAIVTATPERGTRLQGGAIVDWTGAAVILQGKGASVSEVKVLDCRGGGIMLDELGATRISRCEVQNVGVPPGQDAMRATLVESCALAGIRSTGDVIAIRASTVSASDVTGVRSSGGSAGGIFAEVVTGSRVEATAGIKGADFGIRARVVHASGAPDVPPSVAAPPPTAPSGRADAEWPGGLTRVEFRGQAAETKNDLRLLASALEQYAIEHNKGLDEPAPPLPVLAPYISRLQRLRAELEANRCTDVLGRPIVLGSLGDLPVLARATAEHFAPVLPPDYWKPFPVR